MVKNIVLLAALVGIIHAGSLELTYGSTFGRWTWLKESRVITGAYVDTLYGKHVEYELSAGHIYAQPKNPHDHYDNDKAVNYGGVSFRYRLHRFFVGFGVVFVDEITQRLSSSYNFKSQAGILIGPLVFRVEHISNGGIKGPNIGESLVTAGLRYDFAW